MVRPSRSALSPKVGSDLDEHHRGRRREIMRDKLLEQIVGEFRKFVFELELDPRRQKRRALQQAADHRIDAIFEDAAEPLGNARIFVGEFARLLIEQLEVPDCRDREIRGSCASFTDD